jgi:hypothetical protein
VLLGCCGSCVCVTALFLLALVFFLNPCTNDGQCATNNPCTTDYCGYSFCRHDPIDDCCVQDSDCAQGACRDVFCNRVLNTCSARQKMNGTTCNDHSVCTVHDRCLQGECVGNAMNCHADQCANGACHKDRGCVFTNKEDHTACSDDNKCTVGDKCWNGMCVSGLETDCSHLDTLCEVGLCDVVTGNCAAVPKENGLACSNGLMCQEHAACTDGQCVGQPKTCFDNNPCTVDRCVEGVGCMVQFNFTSGVCAPGCTDNSHCTAPFVCHDGTCIDIPPEEDMSIRFIDYNIEPCASGHRLLMSFVFDAAPDDIEGDAYYRVVREAGDIGAQNQPLGFVDEVVTLDSNVIPAGSRSAFTLATACQPVDGNNCQTVFANREYNFDLKLTHCRDITTEPFANCIDANVHAQATTAVSITDCSIFDETQVIVSYGDAVFWWDEQKYVGANASNAIELAGRYNERAYVGIETDVYNNSNFIANLYSVRMCSPKPLHPQAACVTGTNTSWCPYIGCYGWTFESPVLMSYDLMEVGHISAIAKSSVLNTYGCYLDGVYYGTDALRCEQDKCPTSWFRHAMDDGLSFTWDWVTDHDEFLAGANTLVFDIVYRLTGCFDHLRSAETETELHQITTVAITV